MAFDHSDQRSLRGKLATYSVNWGAAIGGTCNAIVIAFSMYSSGSMTSRSILMETI